MNAPVLDLGKGGADPHQLVFDKEGHHIRQSYLFFLAIGEAGHGLAFDERLAVRRLDMAERAGRVADDRGQRPGDREVYRVARRPLDRVRRLSHRASFS